MNGASLEITINHIPAILVQIPAICEQICTETAIEMSRLYEEGAPRETGFMARSSYVKTRNFSTYGDEGGGPMLPEIDAPESKSEADCAVAAEYAAYVEFGTRFMAAQPAFVPSFDLASADFQVKLEQMESRIKV